MEEIVTKASGGNELDAAGAMDEMADIHSDPLIMSGAPVFRGTRIPVHAIAEMMEAGADIDEMMEGYDLTPERVAHAREYAAAHPRTERTPNLDNFRPRELSRTRVPRKGQSTRAAG